MSKKEIVGKLNRSRSQIKSYIITNAQIYFSKSAKTCSCLNANDDDD